MLIPFMNTRVRFALITLAVIVALLTGLAIYVTAVFDPDSFKPDLIRLVKEKKQRHLELHDRITLTLFPTPAISLGKVSLSGHNNTEPFAVTKNIRMSVALLPLLFERKVVLDDTHITGLQATIVRFQDGTTSIDDLLVGADEPAPFKLDIRNVEINDTTLTLQDEATRTKYTLSGLALQADYITGTSPGKMTAIFRITTSRPEQEQPGLTLAAVLESGLLLDIDRQHYALPAFRLSLKGDLKDIKNLVIHASGDLSVQADSATLTVSTLNAGISGLSGECNWDIRLETPRLHFADKQLRSDTATLAVHLDSPQSRLRGDIQLSGISGTAQEIRSNAMTAILESGRDQQLTRINLASPLTGVPEIRQINLPELTVRLLHTDPAIPARMIEGELRGAASINGAMQHAHTSLAGKLADSAIKATASITDFTNPALRFAIDIDRLDMNRLLPQETHQHNNTVPAELPGLSIPDRLHATGSIHIGKFISGDTESSHVRIEIKPH